MLADGPPRRRIVPGTAWRRTVLAPAGGPFGREAFTGPARAARTRADVTVRRADVRPFPPGPRDGAYPLRDQERAPARTGTRCRESAPLREEALPAPV
ncbi:hypothetical protein [Streptomyces tirandamycinicus]|uniref:Uncharacterized protein n=1 Tax=Streptomyces tirandamycinicus TaxID=2174846 RepID=A0A2S1T284_9ACTN|nr:hypothetical protein [Streptomyces tirandamycinicus]AWI32772.1 hypothetical protein DDW44_31150 [Streptomyces tirandamycinicus]